jgi:hypothetical protein
VQERLDEGERDEHHEDADDRDDRDVVGRAERGHGRDRGDAAERADGDREREDLRRVIEHAQIRAPHPVHGDGDDGAAGEHGDRLGQGVSAEERVRERRRESERVGLVRPEIDLGEGARGDQEGERDERVRRPRVREVDHHRAGSGPHDEHRRDSDDGSAGGEPARVSGLHDGLPRRSAPQRPT